ncbi:Aldehyde:ferredoxin oxidoreductase [Candidatus Bipolaricaulis anaerobius]|uniref:Aldehyde:ferredoxin oxidoreductase n=1 Tax=Candidatus Bipolaricaulis anaerobius TaxID=2026885 RepID=A0A2X3L0S9_9BACT|nr:aldehyde ferredoxin oxidoreductase family protein [Candidatus Bipolaricaulis anaerobius]SQD92370.1 Aldehyde:ferredoxin oxidoreductase [Candidatus Bipolaricaulis anaerobius]
MNGVYGRYLDVDLTQEALREREIPPRWYELHLGGRGIAARLLLDLVPPGTDALAPENAVIWATGPFQGTGLAGAGRHVVMAVSPKTGSIADSYVGGYVGHELGRSGYDGIIVRGQAREPVYLLLAAGRAELRAAADLWGRMTGDVDAILKGRHPGVHVAAIGPAGEKLATQACIIHDANRAAGRPGLGAVLGSKRLKAIAVQGHLEKPLADPAGFARAQAAFAHDLMDEGTQRFGELGTARGLAWLSAMGILPTRNFQEGTFDRAAEIGGERMAETILIGRETCAGCPVRCKRVVKTTFGGREVQPGYGGPEYETLAALGSLCLCADLAAIALSNQLCNAYGMDTISVGVAIATLMEASEKGLIAERIPWGDGGAIVAWVERIGRREGLGDAIAAGLDRWAREVGAGFAALVKGVEVPMHEPRGKVGLGLSYALSPRGATHMEGMHDTMLETDSPTPELGITERMDRFALRGKARVVATYEDLRSFVNSLVLCSFVTQDAGPRYNYPLIRELLRHATGIELGPEEMLTVGERNFALLRLYAGRAGHGPEEDRLPPRFHEPLPRGASAGRPMDPATFRAEVAAYYRRRGWTKDGLSAAKLRSLGLEDLAGT